MTPIEEILNATGKLRGVRTSPFTPRGSFLDRVAPFAGETGTVVLMSGGENDSARHHIAGLRPWLSFSARGRRVTLSSGACTVTWEDDPFDALRAVLKAYSIPSSAGPRALEDAPLCAGLMGYLAYDLKDRLEDLPRTSVDDLGLPHVCLFAPSVVLAHDRVTGSTTWSRVEMEYEDGDTRIEAAPDAALLRDAPCREEGIFRGDPLGFRSNFTEHSYKEAVGAVREYIASGHVYQVNISQRFTMGFEGDPFALFRSLFERNPAPFFAYVNAGDHQVVSTSPERFLLLKDGRVESRPIKGTRPRGKTPQEDDAMRRDLQESPKDDAELSMIVDLIRNDIGKVCSAGSVRVAKHKAVEAYENVYHLVSTVEGELSGDKDAVDLLRATFPGGSITGCPKIRSMEIIDELEPTRRHVYTGSIGYLDFAGGLDLSIAIRTATVSRGKIVFSVGGGIVYDSDPGEEYEETLHKGRTLMGVFTGHETVAAPSPHAWLNGSILPESDAAVPLASQGFQYGFGFFETIRAVHGEPRLLDEHIARFNRAWEELFARQAPDLTWDEIIRRVIEKNGLEERVAAVKIMAAAGNGGPGPASTLAVTARPYVHRLEEKGLEGLRVSVYPEPRQTPLAEHKTLNYLFYLLAGKWALARGADEAVVLNPDGSVSETNTGNVIIVNNGTIVTPESPHVLPGIMEAAVCEQLVSRGFRREQRRLFMEDLLGAEEFLVTNSLMGAVPVTEVDGRMRREPSGLWRRINEAVL